MGTYRDGILIRPQVYHVRDLILGDDALSTKPVMHYQGTALFHPRFVCPIPTRGRASQLKVLAMATDCSATCQQG